MKSYNQLKDRRTEQEIREQNKTLMKFSLLFLIAITIAIGIIILFFKIFAK